MILPALLILTVLQILSIEGDQVIQDERILQVEADVIALRNGQNGNNGEIEDLQTSNAAIVKDIAEHDTR